MKIDVRLLGLFLLCVFAFSIVGCFLRRDQDEEEPEDVIASVVSVSPPSGSNLPVNGSITVTFDNPPNTVIASSGTVSVAGKIATITGPFTTGALVLTLTWGDGSYTVNYTVSAPEPDEPDTEPDPESEPEPDVDTEPPKIIDSTVSDGDTDVDPDPINNVGGIEFLFSEEVTGTITLQTENGDDVGWVGEVKGDKGTLQLVKGRELNYETAYVIAGKISDAAGNETDVDIVFATAPEPDTEPPKVDNVTVPSFDAEEINRGGRIRAYFSEEVTGNIILLTEAGDDVGWIGKVEGDKGTLELVRGKELRPGTKYIVWIKISDAAGNEIEHSAPFETEKIVPLPEEMVLIPRGEFQMGSEAVEAAAVERPEHAVHVDVFYIDPYEVTNAQYREFILANPQWQKGLIDRGFHDGFYLVDWNGNNYPPGKEDHPVVDVSWYAAMAYAKWAGKRLPTEAEWEKAARGGLVGRKYPWGNDINPNRANYDTQDTKPVGSYAPNEYDLYDMAGNVWEWCLDEVDVIFYVNSPHDNPIAGGPLVNIVDNFLNVKTDRIRRGGSGFFPPGEDPEWLVGVSRRSGGPPSTTAPNVGFRCVTEQW